MSAGDDSQDRVKAFTEIDPVSGMTVEPAR